MSESAVVADSLKAGSGFHDLQLAHDDVHFDALAGRLTTMTTPREDAGDYEIERTDTRLLLRRGGRTVGTLDWRLVDGAMHIDYVRVDPDLRGQGLGATLVAAAVQDARAGGRRVVPVCSYAAGVLRANPSWLEPGDR